MTRFGRALRHRNYRLFFAGQGMSLIGTWLTRFAMGYETFALTPGKYVMLCFFPDPAKNGLPHALEGMIKEITIS